MVRIRLRRIGARHRPFYRIVVADQRSARNGKVIEQIGTYDPMQDPPEIKINEDAAEKWLRQGAQPSEAVAHMLNTRGITEKAKAVASA
jgi:small subunit ribosomal protein S16